MWNQRPASPSSPYPYRGPSLPMADTMITLLAVSSHTWNTQPHTHTHTHTHARTTSTHVHILLGVRRKFVFKCGWDSIFIITEDVAVKQDFLNKRWGFVCLYNEPWSFTTARVTGSSQPITLSTKGWSMKSGPPILRFRTSILFRMA